MSFFQRRKAAYESLSPLREDDGSFPSLRAEDSLSAGKVRKLTERFESILPGPTVSDETTSFGENATVASSPAFRKDLNGFPNRKPALQFHPLAAIPNTEMETLTTFGSSVSEDAETAFWNDDRDQTRVPKKPVQVETEIKELQKLDELIKCYESEVLDTIVGQYETTTSEDEEQEQETHAEPAHTPEMATSTSAEPTTSVAESLLNGDGPSEDSPDANESADAESIASVIERLRNATPEALPKLLKKEWKRTRLMQANRDFRNQLKDEINVSKQPKDENSKRVGFSETPEVRYIESRQRRQQSMPHCTEGEDFLFPGDCRTSPEILADYLSKMLRKSDDGIFSFLNCLRPTSASESAPLHIGPDTSMEDTTIEVVYPPDNDADDDDDNRLSYEGRFPDDFSVSSRHQLVSSASFNESLHTPLKKEVWRSRSLPETFSCDSMDSEDCTLRILQPLTPEEIVSSFEPHKHVCDSPTDVVSQLKLDESTQKPGTELLPSSFCILNDDPPLTLIDDDEDDDDDDDLPTHFERQSHVHLLEDSANQTALSFMSEGQASF